MTRISQNPYQYAPLIGDARRANLKQFKYGVWFRIKPDHSVVIACLHHRQDSGLVQRRALHRLEPP